MRIKSLAQGENILMLRFEPATFVSKIDILTTTPIVHENRNERGVPLPFHKLSKTRWLVKGKTLYNISVNCEKLLGYFSTCEAKLSINARYTCLLINFLGDERMNYLYLEFSTSVVQEFESINSLFQQANGGLHENKK